MTIGILGGGQLGYMLALAGYPLNFHFRFLDPSPQAPVGRIAPRVTADYTDFEALEKFATGLALVTYEFENVPIEAVHFLQKRLPVYPPPQALEIAQDRRSEKTLFKRLGIPITEFVTLDFADELDQGVRKIGLPAILKTCRLGYDGKGQWLLRTDADVHVHPRRLPATLLRHRGRVQTLAGEEQRAADLRRRPPLPQGRVERPGCRRAPRRLSTPLGRAPPTLR